MLPKKITVNLEYRAEAWFVDSPQIPGLLTCGGTIPLALEKAAHAVNDLALAVAYAHANGETVRPIFREATESASK